MEMQVISKMESGMAFPMSKTVASMLVLAVIDRGDAYGYEIDQTIRQAMGIWSFTSYQILRNLHEQGFLTSYVSLSSGRNRRYYKVTDKGRQQYQELLAAWTAYKEKIDSILGKNSIL